jgi:hypothetical protein
MIVKKKYSKADKALNARGKNWRNKAIKHLTLLKH